MDSEHSQEEVEAVYSLVYASAATGTPSTEELESILARARENNAQADVTGMLVYHEGSFLQALEGDLEIVEALFERIEADPRHTDTVVLFRGMVEERQFSRAARQLLEEAGPARARQGAEGTQRLPPPRLHWQDHGRWQDRPPDSVRVPRRSVASDGWRLGSRDSKRLYGARALDVGLELLDLCDHSLLE